MVIPEDESPRVSLDNFKQRVNQTLQEHDKIMQEQAGIVVTRDSNTLWRDATSQDSAINWTLALRQRALTYLLTASKLLEIHSTSDRYIMMPALQELADLFNEINQPQHWQNEDDAQVNFVTFTDKVFKVLKPRLGTISQKEFNYANAWVSMDMEPQVIVTELNYKGKKYTIKSEPIYGLTDDIVDEFRNRHGKVWYESLSDNTKRICDHYAAKIIAGEHYQLPAALRGVIPGLKNAYETSVYSDGKLLRRFNHCATAPMGKEHMDEAENIRLTQLNYAAMRNGHSNAKLMYTSLVADSLDTVLKLRRDVGNAVNTVMGNAISKEEFIDSTIANIAHRASKMHDNTYHTNVCLNGARIFEPFRLNDFADILTFIESQSIADDSFPRALANAKIKFKKLQQWESTKIFTELMQQDPEVFCYEFLSAFSEVISKYNENVAEENKIHWFFGCASGQNRTQILNFKLVYDAICADSHAQTEKEESELAMVLARSGHFAWINGPDKKYGIRSKSIGSIPKEMLPYVGYLFPEIANSKQPEVTRNNVVTAEDLFISIDKVDSDDTKGLQQAWNKFLKRYPGENVLLQVMEELVSNQQQNSRYELLLSLALNNETVQTLLSRNRRYETLLLQTKQPFNTFVRFVKDKIDTFNKIAQDENDPRVSGWSFKYLQDGTEPPDNSIPPQPGSNDAVKVYHHQQHIFTVLPEYIQSNTADGQPRATKGVSVSVHRHEREDMDLAVQVVLEALPIEEKREVVICVNGNQSQRDKLTMEYTQAVLRNKAKPILTDNGKRLTDAECLHKLKDIAERLNLSATEDGHYVLVQQYEATIALMKATRERELALLEKVKEALNEERVKVSQAAVEANGEDWMRERKAAQRAFKIQDPATNEDLDITAITQRLIEMTFINKNLSTDEMLRVLLQYRQLDPKYYNKQLKPEQVSAMQSDIARKLNGYIHDARNRNNLKPQELASKLLLWVVNAKPEKGNARRIKAGGLFSCRRDVQQLSNSAPIPQAV